MVRLTEAFETLFVQKGIPMSKDDIGDGLTLYRAQFEVRAHHLIGIEMIVEKDEPNADVQISFRWLHQVADYARRNDVLDLINQMNAANTGYYTLFLAGDGEVYLRSLVRCGADISPVYETLSRGHSIVHYMVGKLEELLGPMNN